MTTVRVCSRCGARLPLSAFSKHAGCRLGIRPDCRACVAARSRAHYKHHPTAYKIRADKLGASMMARSPDEVQAAAKARHPAGTKECTVCGRWHPLSAYVACGRAIDGLGSRCGVCRRRICHDWREKNRDARLGRRRTREYERYWADIESSRAAGRARYHRRRQKGWVEVGYDVLLSASGGRCVYCRSEKASEMDHMLPIVRGGKHEVGNVAPSCRRCNSSKGAKTPLEFVIYMLDTKHEGVAAW